MPRLRYRESDIVQGHCAKQITIVRVGSSSGPKPESDSMARATSPIMEAIFVLFRDIGGGGADGRFMRLTYANQHDCKIWVSQHYLLN